MYYRIILLFTSAVLLTSPAEAQKPSLRHSRHAAKKARTEQRKSRTDLKEPSPGSVVIPQESSLHADMKKTKKVVIVPAPPPPPGNDPIPPKRIP